MKKTGILLLLLLIFISCTGDDDGVVVPLQLGKKWVLQNAICYCSFDPDLDFSDHQLDFDTTKNIVSIANSENSYFMLESGEYPYTVSGNVITIDDTLQYMYEIKGNTLILTFVDNPNIADDELTLTYTSD